MNENAIGKEVLGANLMRRGIERIVNGLAGENRVNWLCRGLGQAKDAADEGKGFISQRELLASPSGMRG